MDGQVGILLSSLDFSTRYGFWSFSVDVSDTIPVGVSFSYLSFMTEEYGWFGVGDLAGREKSDFLYFFSGLGNVLVCSLWFFLTVLIGKKYGYKPDAEVDTFFENQRRPVEHKAEGGKDSDKNQSTAMGVLCFIYGGFIGLLGIVIPNSMGGRISFLFCGLVIGGIGFVLHRTSRKKEEPPAEA